MEQQSQVKLASSLNILAGLWVAVSPWVFGYATLSAAVWSSVLVGLAIAILAAIRVFGAYRASWISVINMLLGIWVIFTPWIFGYAVHATAMWDHIIVGVIVAVLGLWSAMAPTAPRSV